MVYDETPLITMGYVAPFEIDKQIGTNCSERVPEGACVQMGIGALPNALATELKAHQNLGLYTEMFADGCLELIEKDIINGACKKIDNGQVVVSFLLGSQRVYDYIDYNEKVLMRDIKYTDDPWVIA